MADAADSTAAEAAVSAAAEAAVSPALEAAVSAVAEAAEAALSPAPEAAEASASPAAEAAVGAAVHPSLLAPRLGGLGPSELTAQQKAGDQSFTVPMHPRQASTFNALNVAAANPAVPPPTPPPAAEPAVLPLLPAAGPAVSPTAAESAAHQPSPPSSAPPGALNPRAWEAAIAAEKAGWGVVWCERIRAMAMQPVHRDDMDPRWDSETPLARAMVCQ